MKELDLIDQLNKGINRAASIAQLGMQVQYADQHLSDAFATIVDFLDEAKEAADGLNDLRMKRHESGQSLTNH